MNEISIFEKINGLNETSTIKEIMEIVDYDFKDNTSVQNIQDPIEKFIVWKNLPGNIHCEKDISNFEMYKALGWIDNDVSKKEFLKGGYYFDIIYSFTNFYALALTVYYPQNFFITKMGHYKVREFEWQGEGAIYKISNGNPRQFVNSSLFLRNTFKCYTEVNHLQCIKDFIKLTHSIGNFMPCPPHPYNIAKGTGDNIKDMLDLMYIKIKNNENIKYFQKEVTNELIDEWKEWFNTNASNIFIEPHLNTPIVEDLSELFQGDFIGLMNKINTRIRIRGLRMIIQITKYNEVKDKCLAKINKLEELA